MTKKYLPQGAKILDGGCGLCGKLLDLKRNGYKVQGVDFSTEAVNKVLSIYPNLNVELGDVKSLSFKPNTFDGYWSVGVIEHFWNGYDEILSEAYRILKPGAVFFLSFPAMCYMRKLKSKLSLYPKWDQQRHSITNSGPEGFYQFLLNPKTVAHDLKKKNFLIETIIYHGSKAGMNQEIPFIWHPVKLLDKKLKILKLFPCHIIADRLCSSVFGHSCCIVAIKR